MSEKETSIFDDLDLITESFYQSQSSDLLNKDQNDFLENFERSSSSFSHFNLERSSSSFSHFNLEVLNSSERLIERLINNFNFRAKKERSSEIIPIRSPIKPIPIQQSKTPKKTRSKSQIIPTPILDQNKLILPSIFTLTFKNPFPKILNPENYSRQALTCYQYIVDELIKLNKTSDSRIEPSKNPKIAHKKVLALKEYFDKKLQQLNLHIENKDKKSYSKALHELSLQIAFFHAQTPNLEYEKKLFNTIQEKLAEAKIKKITKEEESKIDNINYVNKKYDIIDIQNNTEINDITGTLSYKEKSLTSLSFDTFDIHVQGSKIDIISPKNQNSQKNVFSEALQRYDTIIVNNQGLLKNAKTTSPPSLKKLIKPYGEFTQDQIKYNEALESIHSQLVSLCQGFQKNIIHFIKKSSYTRINPLKPDEILEKLHLGEKNITNIIKYLTFLGDKTNTKYSENTKITTDIINMGVQNLIDEYKIYAKLIFKYYEKEIKTDPKNSGTLKTIIDNIQLHGCILKKEKAVQEIGHNMSPVKIARFLKDAFPNELEESSSHFLDPEGIIRKETEKHFRKYLQIKEYISQAGSIDPKQIHGNGWSWNKEKIKENQNVIDHFWGQYLHEPFNGLKSPLKKKYLSIINSRYLRIHPPIVFQNKNKRSLFPSDNSDLVEMFKKIDAHIATVTLEFLKTSYLDLEQKFNTFEYSLDLGKIFGCSKNTTHSIFNKNFVSELGINIPVIQENVKKLSSLFIRFFLKQKHISVFTLLSDITHGVIQKGWTSNIKYKPNYLSFIANLAQTLSLKTEEKKDFYRMLFLSYKEAQNSLKSEEISEDIPIQSLMGSNNSHAFSRHLEPIAKKDYISLVFDYKKDCSTFFFPLYLITLQSPISKVILTTCISNWARKRISNFLSEEEGDAKNLLELADKFKDDKNYFEMIVQAGVECLMGNLKIPKKQKERRKSIKKEDPIKLSGIPSIGLDDTFYQVLYYHLQTDLSEKVKRTIFQHVKEKSGIMSDLKGFVDDSLELMQGAEVVNKAFKEKTTQRQIKNISLKSNIVKGFKLFSIVGSSALKVVIIGFEFFIKLIKKKPKNKSWKEHLFSDYYNAQNIYEQWRAIKKVLESITDKLFAEHIAYAATKTFRRFCSLTFDFAEKLMAIAMFILEFVPLVGQGIAAILGLISIFGGLVRSSIETFNFLKKFATKKLGKKRQEAAQYVISAYLEPIDSKNVPNQNKSTKAIQAAKFADAIKLSLNDIKSENSKALPIKKLENLNPKITTWEAITKEYHIICKNPSSRDKAMYNLRDGYFLAEKIKVKTSEIYNNIQSVIVDLVCFEKNKEKTIDTYKDIKESSNLEVINLTNVIAGKLISTSE